jgi:PilZ domain
MELTPEQFERIAGVPVPPSPAQKAADKNDAVLPVGARRVSDLRAAARIGLGKRAKIRTMRGEQAGIWQTVIVQDISVTGVGILGDESMEAGDQFILHLQDTQDQTVPLKCNVCRCEPGGFGGVSFMIGAQFGSADEEIPAPTGAVEEMMDSMTPAVPETHSTLVMTTQVVGTQAASTRQLLQFFTGVGEMFRAIFDRTMDLLQFWKHKDDFSAPTHARRKRRSTTIRFKSADLATVRLGNLVCWP